MESHRFDPLSAAFGLVFSLVALSSLLGDLGVQWRLVWPAAIVIIGLAMLVAALRGPSRE